MESASGMQLECIYSIALNLYCSFEVFKTEILCDFSRDLYVMALGIGILESIHLQVRKSAWIFEITASTS